MEAFGFGMSVAAVLGAFQNCIKLYSDILSIRNRDEDVQAACMLIKIELFIFKRLNIALANELSETSQARSLCNGILGWVQDDLARILDLLVRHSPKTPQGAGPASSSASSESIEIYAVDKAMAPGGAMRRVKRLAHSVTWIASDKERLKMLATRLHQWNEGLGVLIPEVKRRRIDYEAVSISIGSDSFPQLDRIERATETGFPAIAQSAEVRKMTIRSRGRLVSPEQASLGEAQFKLSIDCFQWRVTAASASLLTPGEHLSSVSALERAFAIYEENRATGTSPISVVVEWRDNFRSEESHKQFAYRLDYLVTILRKMSRIKREQSRAYGFNVLPCLGWITSSPNFDRIGLVFCLPPESVDLQIPDASGGSRSVMTLHECITKTRKERRDAPALGKRFRLALSLAQTLGSLNNVGWVHKELRSHNILLIRQQEADDPVPDLLYLSGFTYARPSGDSSQDLSQLNPDPAYDLYRPSRYTIYKYQEQRTLRDRARLSSRPLSVGGLEIYDGDGDDEQEIQGFDEEDPSALARGLRWTCALDIYGLGIILLEIGLWRTIQELKGPRTSTVSFLSHGLEPLVQSLSYRMGDLYHDVVQDCLRLGDWIDDEQKSSEFWASSIEKLALCNA